MNQLLPSIISTGLLHSIFEEFVELADIARFQYALGGDKYNNYEAIKVR